MADYAVTLFKLRNDRGLAAPRLHMVYVEKESGITWHIQSGGTRSCLVRVGEILDGTRDEEAADSHFMIRRVTSALVLGGSGLFAAEASGRLIFSGVEGKVTWNVDIDQIDPRGDSTPQGVVDKVSDWWGALSTHTALRRSAQDAYLALSHPHEALVFVYRGLEWLKIALNMRWEELATPLGTTAKNIKELTRLANVETGVRHASRSGRKLRADIENDATWICALIDAINFARTRLEPEFIRMSADEVSSAVLAAVHPRAYD